MPNAKPEVFIIHLTKQGPLPAQLVIDSVNGKAVEAMPLTIVESKMVYGSADAIATIKLTTLAVSNVGHFTEYDHEHSRRVFVQSGAVHEHRGPQDHADMLV